MINYYDYIQSDEWYKRTEKIRERNGGRCECCKMRYGSEVHHRTYERLGNEKEEDLIHICHTCHEYIHDKREKIWVWPSRVEFLNQLREEQRRVRSSEKRG